jgi:hypothetical protein
MKRSMSVLLLLALTVATSACGARPRAASSYPMGPSGTPGERPPGVTSSPSPSASPTTVVVPAPAPGTVVVPPPPPGTVVVPAQPGTVVVPAPSASPGTVTTPSCSGGVTSANAPCETTVPGTSSPR